MSIRENTVMKTPETKVWTDAEFMALPDDGNRYELVKGELVNLGNSGALHGYIAIILSAALFALVTSRKLWVLLESSTAFTMKNGNKRSPDIAFFAKKRLQGLEELPTGFLEGGPDLVVEILSPGNTVAEIEDKIAEYFANGTRLLWVISPGQHYVLVYRSGYEPQELLTSADFLEGEEVVPGFTFPVADLFQKLSL
ncbi:Uma2 family endonuclease [Microcystis sp. M061S2]|uniref:Uma2 family endonuclease n=1 Tax=Microcystis sp. M061S2 TaxID=2771171 RepID=UPI00258CAE2D|nr:Uma2 family endonuclease [Microcystis sp. M061S2]MCA2654053.1 Uma2 family endonuclease [Microcystis sp. M061S2]